MIFYSSATVIKSRKGFVYRLKNYNQNSLSVKTVDTSTALRTCSDLFKGGAISGYSFSALIIYLNSLDRKNVLLCLCIPFLIKDNGQKKWIHYRLMNTYEVGIGEF